MKAIDADRISTARSAWGFSAEPGQGWRDAALCAQVDLDLWFPDTGGSTRDAKRVCFQCPVRLQCLEYAVERKEPWGVWGGLSQRERRHLRAERRKAC